MGSILKAGAGSGRTVFLLFAGYVDAATSFAQNCGGGGSAPDQDWGRDKNEDDVLWARRCFRKAREMVTTPVIRRGMKKQNPLSNPTSIEYQQKQLNLY